MPGRTAFSRLTLFCALLASVASAPRLSAQSSVADIREDVKGLNQRVEELSLRIEQLEHDNAELRTKIASGRNHDLVTTAELNGAVADLNASIKSAVDSSRAEVLQKVATQMEILAKQTNAALDSLAKQAAPAQPRPAPIASSARPPGVQPALREGASYTVQKGDSLGIIARKTGVRSQDIAEANQISDPSRIQVGQVLVIPGK